MDIDKKILMLRKEKKISQTNLAKEIGVSSHLIAMWEKGKSLPTASNIAKLCLFFNVSSDWLLGLKK